MKKKLLVIICLLCISLCLNSCDTLLSFIDDTDTDGGKTYFTPADSPDAGECEDDTTTADNGEDSTTDDISGEDNTTESNSSEDNTTESGSGEDSTTKNNSSEDVTTNNKPQNTLSAKKTHFNDSLSTNGPMTDYCLPSIGSPRVLVVPINLKSSNATQAMLNNIDIAFNGSQSQTGWYSVSEYYYVSSYSKLNIEFDVLDEWFTPEFDADYYDIYYDDTTGYYGSTLILDEVLEYYDDTIDFSQYDSNNDDIIDGIWLIYNCDVNYDDANSDYWAYVYQTGSEILVDGVYAYYYGYAGTDFMFETNVDYPNDHIKVDAHTYIHETGHLMGLDDYYDYDENVGPAGGFYTADMMDSNIGDHSSFSKLLLGWIDPIVVSGTGSLNIDIQSFAKSGDVILIAKNGISSIYSEYILIEFYTDDLLNENDMPIYPSSYNTSDIYGIRVLHIDARKFYNNNGEVDFNTGDYLTGFVCDNSDEELLLVDTLYCELNDSYATDDILFTPTSQSFASLYSNYTYHNGNPLDFTFTVNSMTATQASLTITVK